MLLYSIAVLCLLLFAFLCWFLAPRLLRDSRSFKAENERPEVENAFRLNLRARVGTLLLALPLTVAFVVGFRVVIRSVGMAQLSTAEVVTPTLLGLGIHDPEKVLRSLEEASARKLQSLSVESDSAAGAESKEEALDRAVQAGLVQRFLRGFFDDTSSEIEGKGVLEHFGDVFVSSSEVVNCYQGLTSLVSKLGMAIGDSEEQQFLDYLNRSLLPEVFPVWLGGSPDYLPSPDRVLDGMRSEDTQLRDLQVMLARHFAQTGEEGALARVERRLLTTYIQRTGEQAEPYFRIAMLVSGVIQFATFLLFFWALGLLACRKRRVGIQRSIEGEWRNFWKESDILTDAKRAELTEKRGDQLVAANAQTIDEEDAAAEVGLLAKFGNYMVQREHRRAQDAGDSDSDLSSDRKLIPIYYRLIALENVWSTIASHAGNQQLSRDVLAYVRELVERTEGYLQRVEYSIIDWVAWAMPSLGFIGTVLGIAQALGDADEVVRAADAAAQASAISAVTSVLGIAFDTTLIALVCGIPTMFIIQRLRSIESQFLLEFEQAVSSRIARQI